jgi:hypothetical protein
MPAVRSSQPCSDTSSNGTAVLRLFRDGDYAVPELWRSELCRAPPEHLRHARPRRCLRVALRELLLVRPSVADRRVGHRGNRLDYHLEYVVSDGASLMNKSGGAQGSAMTQFERIDHQLASSVPGNGWSDDGVLLAAELLQSFRSEDWDDFARNWIKRPVQWQCFAADVLIDGNPEKAIPVLLDMILLGPEQIKCGACDSLRVMLQGRAAPLVVRPDMKATVERLLAESSGLMRQSLSQLQSMLTD